LVNAECEMPFEMRKAVTHRGGAEDAEVFRGYGLGIRDWILRSRQ
jgi:hypothetical protein